VFKSTDGGLSWIALTGLPPNNYVFVIHPQNSRLIYAAGPHVYQSADGGETWGTFGPAATFGALALAPQNPDVVYAGSWAPDGRVFKSPDGGRTWIPPTENFAENYNGFKVCSPGVISLAVDSKNPDKVYAGLSDCNDQWEDIRRSADGGTSWERTNAFTLGIVVADPQQADVVYAGFSDGVAKSTDGGKSWNKLTSGLPSPFLVTALAIDPQTSNTLYAAGYISYNARQSGLFKSIDGGANWSEFDDGLAAPSIDTLIVTSHGPNTLYASSSQTGVFKAFDDTPVLSLDSTRYCIGDTWKLKVANGVTNTSIRLLGTSNGQSWEVQDWRMTDGDGNSSEAGVFAAGTEGSHFLRVDINARLSNVVSFVVSYCGP
jgi:photosystem II stability/assembly factor-like uncharacterized protein